MLAAIRRWTDTLLARLLLVSLTGITLFHVLSLWTYEQALDRELTAAYESRLVERLVSIKRSVMLVPPRERETLAHDLSSGPLEAHWNTSRGASTGGPGIEMWQPLAERVRAMAGDLKADDVVIGTSTDPHVALLSIRLPDDTWLNVNLFALSRSGMHDGHGTLLSTSLMAGGVIVMSVLLAGWLTRPIRRIAHAVTHLSPDDPKTDVPAVGPSEVRHLALAFNDMRARIADLVERRTRALAAVSHDLRTPLTRLRLRLDDVADPALQSAMSRDITEMEQMIEATLAYLKGDARAEAARPLDLVALLQTIVDDARDQGANAVVHGPATLVVDGRLIGLRRAFANLVGNALRFATRCDVTLTREGDLVVVWIDDDGPGIPGDKRVAVLEPFVRLEDSRNLETGGVGLGLTIAKANIEADGGTLRLLDSPAGGLRAEVTLPMSGA